MRPQCAKAKGRRLQQEVAASIRRAFPHLGETDVASVAMGRAGEDIVLSPAAESVFPYSVECKCVERLNVWSALAQASRNASEEKTPILAIRRNRQEAHAVVPWDHFVALVAAAASKPSLSSSSSELLECVDRMRMLLAPGVDGFNHREQMRLGVGEDARAGELADAGKAEGRHTVLDGEAHSGDGRESRMIVPGPARAARGDVDRFPGAEDQ